MLFRLEFKCKLQHGTFRESFLNVHWLSYFRGCFCRQTNYFTNFHENNCSFQFELTQKLKQLNIKFLIIPLVKREAESFCNRKLFCKNTNWTNTNGQNKLAMYFIMFHIKSNLIIPLREGWKNFSSCCVIVLSYIFLDLCPFHSWRSAIYLRSVRSTDEPKWCARNHWWTLHFAVFAFSRV